MEDFNCQGLQRINLSIIKTKEETKWQETLTTVERERERERGII